MQCRAWGPLTRSPTPPPDRGNPPAQRAYSKGLMLFLTALQGDESQREIRNLEKGGCINSAAGPRAAYGAICLARGAAVATYPTPALGFPLLY